MNVPTIRLSSPADLLAAIPHMLGFQPAASVVTVALHEGPDGLRRLGMVARLDLPAEGQSMAAAESLDGRYPLRTAAQFLGPQVEDILAALETVTIECNSSEHHPFPLSFFSAPRGR